MGATGSSRACRSPTAFVAMRAAAARSNGGAGLSDRPYARTYRSFTTSAVTSAMFSVNVRSGSTSAAMPSPASIWRAKPWVVAMVAASGELGAREAGGGRGGGGVEVGDGVREPVSSYADLVLRAGGQQHEHRV